MKLKVIVLGVLVAFFVLPVEAQDRTNNKFGKGIKVVAKDSSFSIRFGARIQSLYVGEFSSETREYSDRFVVRRFRLKADGFAHSPKLSYKIELGLSANDMSGSLSQTSKSSNIIYDAVLKYSFSKNWSVWFGQTKLPGNMERVISSGSLQFVDRSELNAGFNIDRDAGVQLHYNSNHIRLISSISSGEGRNITSGNVGGYDYTNRVEWLPFGLFNTNGDYSGGDLSRQSTPKFILGATYDFNDRASRERGQLGNFLSEQRSLETWFIDTHFKYKGISLMGEFVKKAAVRGSAIYDETGTYVESFYVGTGLNAQAGYLFKNNIEVAARFTNVVPAQETLKAESNQYTLGLSKYIVGHSLKMQGDATLITETNTPNQFMYRFQIEFAL